MATQFYHSHLAMHRDVLTWEISHHYNKYRDQWNTTLEREEGERERKGKDEERERGGGGRERKMGEREGRRKRGRGKKRRKRGK